MASLGHDGDPARARWPALTVLAGLLLLCGGAILHASPMVLGAIAAVLAIVHASDVRRQRAEALEAQALRTRSRAIDQCSVSICLTDAAGVFQYVNPCFTAETGYTMDDVRGRTPRILSSGLQPKAFFDEMWATIKAGGQWRGELWNRRKNGDLFCELLSVSPVRQAGEITHFLGVFYDTTRQKRAEEALQAAHEAARVANLSKSMFIANMSHEIRTPMTAILGITDLMRHDTRLQDDQQRDLAAIADNGARLLALIEDILQMSEIEAGRAVADPRPFDLFALFDDITTRFEAKAASKGLAFNFERDPALPRRAVADVGKLQHVLVNLLDNAFKFTARGRVNVLARLERGRPDRLSIAVEDTGPGMAAHEMGAIFEAFSQTQAQRNLGGTGLGLAISGAWVRLMGGELTVSSQVGRGTLFQFSVDLLEAPPEEAPARDEEPAEGTLRVLVVDDEEAIRALVRRLLERPGIEVLEAESGEEAIACCERAAPHLVFMDHQMAGIDGLEATRRLKSRGGDPVRVVLASGTRFSGRRPEGPDHFITKPYGAPEIAAAVRRVMGRRLDPPATTSPRAAAPLTAADLRTLGDEVRAELRTAAALLDLERVSAVAAAIEDPTPAIALKIRDLVRRCDLQRLTDLFALEESVP